MQQNIDRTGSTTSWSQWSAAIGWLYDLMQTKKDYLYDPLFVQFRKAAQKLYGKSKDARLPFKTKHLLVFLRSIGWNGYNHRSLPYDVFIAGVLLLAFFFGIQRPSELVKVLSNARKTGLAQKDVTFIRKQPLSDSYMLITIRSMKNAATRNDHKYIPIGQMKCRRAHQCSKQCAILDLFTAFVVLFERLDEVQNVPRHPDSPLFCWQNGTPINYTDVAALVKRVVAANNLKQSKCYTPYSLRIGGTTTASLQGVNHRSIMVYVCWSTKNYPDSMMGYIRPGHDILKRIPFDMVHGVPGKAWDDDRCALVFDPWEMFLNGTMTRRR